MAETVLQRMASLTHVGARFCEIFGIPVRSIFGREVRTSRLFASPQSTEVTFQAGIQWDGVVARTGALWLAALRRHPRVSLWAVQEGREGTVALSRDGNLFARLMDLVPGRRVTFRAFGQGAASVLEIVAFSASSGSYARPSIRTITLAGTISPAASVNAILTEMDSLVTDQASAIFRPDRNSLVLARAREGIEAPAIARAAGFPEGEPYVALRIRRFLGRLIVSFTDEGGDIRKTLKARETLEKRLKSLRCSFV